MMNITGADETSTEKTSRNVITKPPDGRWGWVVVFSSFAIHVVADGVKYTFSIFYEELLKEFKESKAKTSIVSSVMFSAYLLVGPGAGWLIERYGCRAIAILGSACASFGLTMSVIATSITHLVFTAGLCTGIGLGLLYVTAIVCVSLYFEDRRAFAIGIATSGTGIGTFVTLYCIILVDIVGLDLLTTALGVSLVFEGLACLIGPPVVGLIYDYCGSYCPGLILSGSMIALSGLMVFFIPCIQKMEPQHKQKTEETQINIPVNITGATNSVVFESCDKDTIPSNHTELSPAQSCS